MYENRLAVARALQRQVDVLGGERNKWSSLALPSTATNLPRLLYQVHQSTIRPQPWCACAEPKGVCVPLPAAKLTARLHSR